MVKISVIIPVHNDKIGLRKTLNSLKKQKRGMFTYEIIAEEDKREEGSYKTRNKAIQQSSGDLLAFIDAGTEANVDWLKKGYEYIKKYDYVGGKVNLKRKSNNFISKALYIYGNNREFAVSEFINDSHFAPTTNLFVKGKVFKEVGHFDERLKSSGDLEFGSRVYASGFSQYYAKDLVVTHETRNFLGYLNKHKRLAKGFFDLMICYPDRFSFFKYNIFKVLLPPVWLLSKRSFLNLNLGKRAIVFIMTYLFSFFQHLVFTKHFLFHILKFY